MLKKILKVTTFVLVALLTLIVTLVVEENIRGKAAWERHLRELEAKGDTLDILKIAPPPVPDAQNLASAPLFAELMTASNASQTRLHRALSPLVARSTHAGDWRLGQRANLPKLQAAFSNANLLAAFEPARATFTELEEACAARPQCRFPVAYEKGFAALLPHASSINLANKALRLRALAELDAGQTDAAGKDIRLMVRMGETIRDEPLLISLLVRVSAFSQALQPLWEGLADHSWSEEQLKQFQQDLAAINLMKQLDLALHGERCMAKWALDTLLANPKALMNVVSGSGDSSYPPAWNFIPSAFVYFNCLNIDLFYQHHILPGYDRNTGRINPAHVKASENAFVGRGWKAFPYHVLENLLVPAVTTVTCKAGSAHTMVQSATLACVLERYRIANGRYPDQLDALVPQFIAAVPRDVVDGQPLRYRRDGEGFIIYAVGWNQADDQGAVGLTTPNQPGEQPRLDEKQGDWVWRSQPVP
jgi:hypothetical protein